MYNLSRDYDKLYELVCKGIIAAGFVDYQECRDICQIRKTKFNSINFGVRGHSYSEIDLDDGKDRFMKPCERLDLEWIAP